MAFTFLPAEDSTTLALQQQVARLQALVEASRQVHAAVRLEDAMRLVLKIIVRELEVAGALFTHPLMSYGSVPPEPWEGCVRFPLYGKDGQVITELVVSPGGKEPLTIYEEDFLQGLVLQASVAFENARYHERNVQWARVEQDLAAARAIQRSLLPQTMPSLPGYCVALRSSACYEVGGDYADILTLPSGGQMMVVADVAGKGLASAIMSTAFRAAFRAMARTGLPLGEVAVRLNQEHWGEGPEARLRYVTAIFLRLDISQNRIEVVNAGHSPGFLVDKEGGRLIHASGAPLGLLPGRQYVAEEFHFRPGARLLLYTDGLTDQSGINSAGGEEEEFGPDRLFGEFARCPENECPAILDWLWRRVSEFSEGVEQQDDMTALVLARSSAEENAAGLTDTGPRW
jgi:sigma-B regulation protein RsbU (phosphoserine phosphatase)